MKYSLLCIVIFVCTAAHAEPIGITFETPDGIKIYGEIYKAVNAPMSAPVILLFHQGASNARSEYGPLLPQLGQQGYHAIAIDQRRGGDRFGGANRTLAGVGDTEYSYCDVYSDMEATLRFAKDYGFTGKTVVWGSSYSAALVFKLGVEHRQEIDAVLAFSPASGEPMDGCRPEPYSERITLPVLALRPLSELQVPYVPDQMKLFEKHGHQTYVADPAVHASSMLNEARVGSSTADTWKVVLDFLQDSLAD